MEEANRKPPGQQQSAIGFAQGVLQRAIANESAVEKQVLHPIVGPIVRRVGDMAKQPHVAVLALDGDEGRGHVGAV